jgi:hypothetical protein
MPWATAERGCSANAEIVTETARAQPYRRVGAAAVAVFVVLVLLGVARQDSSARSVAPAVSAPPASGTTPSQPVPDDPDRDDGYGHGPLAPGEGPRHGGSGVAPHDHGGGSGGGRGGGGDSGGGGDPAPSAPAPSTPTPSTPAPSTPAPSTGAT